jgi:hypothetical protein
MASRPWALSQQAKRANVASVRGCVGSGWLPARLLSLLVVVPVHGKLRGQAVSRSSEWSGLACSNQLGLGGGEGRVGGMDTTSSELCQYQHTHFVFALWVVGGSVDCVPGGITSAVVSLCSLLVHAPFSSFRGGVEVVLITPDKSAVRCIPMLSPLPCPARGKMRGEDELRMEIWGGAVPGKRRQISNR